MKKLIIAITFLVIAGCAKTPVKQNISPEPTPFSNSFPTWSQLKLKGSDTTTSDIITSLGLDNSNSYYGRFYYRSDTYTINVTPPGTWTYIEVSAANNYTLNGSCDTVTIHKINGGGLTWTATLGTFQYLHGREYYQLLFITHTTLFSNAYTDSL